MADLTEERFSSNSVEYETPLSLFDPLDSEFSFDIDVCANETNKKVERYFDKETDGLSQNWVGNCWCNPPYGRELPLWIKKAINTVAGSSGTVVMLIPARTNTIWWHDLVMKYGEIRFVKGRPKFNNGKHGLPFPLAIIIFKSVAE